MPVAKFSVADAPFARTPGQDAEVYVGNIVDQRHGGPVTIGYGRYGPNESIDEDIAVDDVMIVLEGRIHVSSDAGEDTAGPGEIIYMPRGSSLTISTGTEGALIAYVTYPHWQA